MTFGILGLKEKQQGDIVWKVTLAVGAFGYEPHPTCVLLWRIVLECTPRSCSWTTQSLFLLWHTNTKAFLLIVVKITEICHHNLFLSYWAVVVLYSFIKWVDLQETSACFQHWFSGFNEWRRLHHWFYRTLSVRLLRQHSGLKGNELSSGFILFAIFQHDNDHCI